MEMEIDESLIDTLGKKMVSLMKARHSSLTYNLTTRDMGSSNPAYRWKCRIKIYAADTKEVVVYVARYGDTEDEAIEKALREVIYTLDPAVDHSKDIHTCGQN